MSKVRIVAIIQARLTSTRFPGKVLEKLGDKSLISRVCEAARNAALVDKVVVAWAHKFPHLEENDVLSRYQEIAEREHADIVVRLTSDCPCLTSWHIDNAIGCYFSGSPTLYYCNRDDGAEDGFDVQVFSKEILSMPGVLDKEHVIAPPKKYSVDTPQDLENLRTYVW